MGSLSPWVFAKLLPVPGPALVGRGVQGGVVEEGRALRELTPTRSLITPHCQCL
jgi:hypothetical protein